MLGDKQLLSLDERPGKQLVFIAISLVAAIIIYSTDVNIFPKFAYFIYAAILLSLVAVYFLGTEIKGSRSWFRIGSFGIQPSEFAKFATTLALAKYFTQYHFKKADLKQRAISFGIVLLPIALIILQGDAGTAASFLALTFVYYRAGVSIIPVIIGVLMVVLYILCLLYNPWIISAGLLLLLGFLIFFLARKKRAKRNRQPINLSILVFVISLFFIHLIVPYTWNKVLKPHHQNRILVFLGEQIDRTGPGYQVWQSKLAIGSGGLTGKGYLDGALTKGDHVPDQSTDFIFSTIGEEFGFIGSTIIILAFLALMVRIIMLAERQRSEFSRLYGYGLASFLFLHFTVNIGMVLGLVPVAGIPLPFISYGGSGIIGFSIMFAIFVKLDAQPTIYLPLNKNGSPKRAITFKTIFLFNGDL